MTSSEMIKALTYFNEAFPRHALQAAVQQKEDSIPHLLEALDYANDNARELMDEESDYMLHIYAMYLLAQFREKKAFPKLVRMMAQEREMVDFIIGETLTEDYAAILCSTYDGSLGLLQEVIENAALDDFIRSTALRAYVFLYQEGLLPRHEVADYLKSLMREHFAQDASCFPTMVAHSVMDAHLLELIPDVAKLYDRDAIDPMFFGEYDSFIDYLFDYSHHADKCHYIGDAIAEMQSWPCFKAPQSKTPKHALAAHKPKKPGRNDPCPCGSGKKYKKCCLAAEEKNASSRNAGEPDFLLKYYPNLQKGGKDADVVLFADYYSPEAIAMDIPVYKAMHHRSIPVWIPRDRAREDLSRIDFLLEAFEMFTQTCRREEITSFAVFDEKYMVHYRSAHWVGELERLLTEHQSTCGERQAGFLQPVGDTVKRFA